jgi:hypothetical protein
VDVAYSVCNQKEQPPVWLFLNGRTDVDVNQLWSNVISVRPWLATASGVLVIAYFAMLGLGRLFDIWRSFQTRRAILEEEKIVNEILKIRYEIEVLRKQHDLPDLTAADRPVAAAPQHEWEQAGAARAHARFGFSLPEIPTFSFSPVLSLFKVPLKRPGAGIARSYWALKLLGALLLAFIVAVFSVMSLVPGGSQENVGATLVVVAGLIAGYLLSALVYNLGRAAFSALAADWRHGTRKAQSTERRSAENSGSTGE